MFKKNSLLWLALVFLLLTGCQTAPRLPRVDLAQPGWTTRQGQAVWRERTGEPEIAGELLVATRADGACLVEFTKTPLPMIVLQTTTNAWQFQYVPANRTYSGRGAPPTRVAVWLHLARCLAGSPPPKLWQWNVQTKNSWRLANPYSGEFLEGYLAP
jgi:hypothetical protein